MIGGFTQYFDESYTHPPEPRVHTVAGYLSTDAQWVKFRREWRRLLGAEGLDHFHMVDFQACKPPFDSWSKEKRTNFLKSLHDVIKKRTIISFATTADLDEFDQLSDEQKRALISPHAFAAKNCMKGLGFWAAFHIVNHPVIEYVFEEGQPHQKQINRMIETLTDEDRWFFRMASIRFAPKKGRSGLNPLQSADMVAYEATKDISRKLNPLNTRKARLSGLNLASDPSRHIWRYCGRLDFIETISDAEKRAKEYASQTSEAEGSRVMKENCVLWLRA